MQRALPSVQPAADLDRSAILAEFQAFIAVFREVATLALERSDSLEDLRLHQMGRFEALARVHAQLVRDGGPIDFETLVWDELAGGLCPAEQDRITIAGPSVAFERPAAELIALLIHELATNALKFGGLSDDVGRVDVIWHVKDEGETFYLSWLESGAPPPDHLPTRCGFGREMIETILPRRLGARTEFTLSPCGLRCEVELPFAAAAKASGEVRSDNMQAAA